MGPVVVTGANSGVGRSAVRLLAEAGARVVMVCRSRRRGEDALDDVLRERPGSRLELEIADLSSLASVGALAGRLLDRFERIGALVNNAGVFRARREITDEGFEVTMATNHLGHFLLTLRLREPLVAGGARIVSVSSEGHREGDLHRAPLEAILRGEVSYRGRQAYGDSKLANVLFAFEIARRWGADGVTANAVHPGVLSTRIWDKSGHPLGFVMRLAKPFMDDPRVGGRAVVRLALAPELERASARYFDRDEETRAAPQAYDEELAAELWRESERLTGA